MAKSVNDYAELGLHHSTIENKTNGMQDNKLKEIFKKECDIKITKSILHLPEAGTTQRVIQRINRVFGLHNNVVRPPPKPSYFPVNVNLQNQNRPPQPQPAPPHIHSSRLPINTNSQNQNPSNFPPPYNTTLLQKTSFTHAVLNNSNIRVDMETAQEIVKLVEGKKKRPRVDQQDINPMLQKKRKKDLVTNQNLGSSNPRFQPSPIRTQRQDSGRSISPLQQFHRMRDNLSKKDGVKSSEFLNFLKLGENILDIDKPNKNIVEVMDILETTTELLILSNNDLSLEILNQIALVQTSITRLRNSHKTYNENRPQQTFWQNQAFFPQNPQTAANIQVQRPPSPNQPRTPENNNNSEIGFASFDPEDPMQFGY